MCVCCRTTKTESGLVCSPVASLIDVYMCEGGRLDGWSVGRSVGRSIGRNETVDTYVKWNHIRIDGQTYERSRILTHTRAHAHDRI